MNKCVIKIISDGTDEINYVEQGGKFKKVKKIAKKRGEEIER
jgi:hypothetical protein